MKKLLTLIFVLISFLLSSCDFYTLYIIKKSLEGDFDYVDSFSRKYKLKGDSFSDVPISEEEKIVPEFVEDKVVPLESEIDLFPSSKEKSGEVNKIFTTKGQKITIELPKENGVWIIKKYPSLVASFDISSPVKENKFYFNINSFGKDSAIFQLFSSNGVVLKTYEYEINVIENLKDASLVSTSTNVGLPTVSNNYEGNNEDDDFSSGSSTKSKQSGTSSTNSLNESSGKGVNNSITNEFDITDNEKEEISNTNIVEPVPPSQPGVMDLKSLVGNETKFFENIDNIANKYGYYRALKEIENIEPNVSPDDLPKLKIKKMELLGKLKRYADAIKEGEEFVERDNFIKLYTGIFFGMSKNYFMADKHIKDSLQKMVLPRDISYGLSKALEYYNTIPDPPTTETINFLLQKNEFLQKDFKDDYYKNLLSIGSLYERIGEVYKAKAIYEKVFLSADAPIKEEANTKMTNLDLLLDYK